MCIDRTTLQELGCNGLHMKKKQMKIETERSDKMTTKEVARICGVADRTVSGNAAKAGVVLENGKSHDWTEEEVKRLQLVLMGNQVKQGTQTETVKSNLETAFELGTLANIALTSGNVEAVIG